MKKIVIAIGLTLLVRLKPDATMASAAQAGLKADPTAVALPPNGVHPQAIEHDPRTYTAAPAMENISVFRFVNAEGLVLLVAPALNDFPLRTDKPGGGREVFSNIFIRDQPAGVFEPPASVFIHVHTEAAAGVLVYPAGQNPRTK